jgi:hypothetical protein
MAWQHRIRRFPRTAPFIRSRRNTLAWAFWCGLLVRLLAAFREMIL